MERVVFLIEQTNQRIGCLLNPESLTFTRAAGVKPRQSLGGPLAGAGLSDYPLLYIGGGRTELELDLLFDINLDGSSIQTEDVRDLTTPFWDMTENTVGADGFRHPPLVRFIWGKAWNVPGVVTAVAERLEFFTPTGTPQRSLLRMRFVRTGDPDEGRPREPIFLPPELEDFEDITPFLVDREEMYAFTADDRLDELAFRYYGDPQLWRLIARYNDVPDPLNVAPGTLLNIPGIEITRRRA